MNIEEARKKKMQLEAEIQDLLIGFQELTGLYVMDVDVDTVQTQMIGDGWPKTKVQNVRVMTRV